jgi:hypothetical protein
MFDISRWFTNGLQNTILVKNNAGTSHNGPWKQVFTNTLVDRWHVRDLGAAEYTIFCDLNTGNKEIIKCLVTATIDDASVVIYARNNTNQELITLDVFVNESYVELYASPKNASLEGSKLIFTPQYFHNQNIS